MSTEKLSDNDIFVRLDPVRAVYPVGHPTRVALNEVESRLRALRGEVERLKAERGDLRRQLSNVEQLRGQDMSIRYGWQKGKREAEEQNRALREAVKEAGTWLGVEHPSITDLRLMDQLQQRISALLLDAQRAALGGSGEEKE